jgi:hypothetical protein
MPPEESLLFAQASHFSLTYGIGVYQEKIKNRKAI